MSGWTIANIVMCLSLFFFSVMSADNTKFQHSLGAGMPETERELMTGVFFYIFLFLFIFIEAILFGLGRQ